MGMLTTDNMQENDSRGEALGNYSDIGRDMKDLKEENIKVKKSCSVE